MNTYIFKTHPKKFVMQIIMKLRAQLEKIVNISLVKKKIVYNTFVYCRIFFHTFSYRYMINIMEYIQQQSRAHGLVFNIMLLFFVYVLFYIPNIIISAGGDVACFFPNTCKKKISGQMCSYFTKLIWNLLTKT